MNFPPPKDPKKNTAYHWLLTFVLYACCISVSDWLKAGIQLADSVVVFSPGHTGDSTDHPEHVVDAATIMAVKMLSK